MKINRNFRDADGAQLSLESMNMDKKVAIIILAAIFSVIVIFFFTRFLRTGKFKIKIPFFGEVNAEGSNPPPPKLTLKNVETGKDVLAHNSAGGDANLENINAEGSVDASVSNGGLPPKR